MPWTVSSRARRARIRFSGEKLSVIDGPFAETKELVAGFWLIEVKSKQEAIEWMKRCPPPMGPGVEAEIEIRQIFEMSDLFPSDEAARKQGLRDELAKKPSQG